MARRRAPTCSSNWSCSLRARRVEPRTPLLVFVNPLFRVRSVLDFLQHLLHFGAVASLMTRWAAGVIAVFGGVADRVAHVVEAALIHEIDDELQFVQALEIGDLGLISGIDQRLESGLHQLAGAAAEHGLLAEQIGFGFLGEGGFEHARAGSRREPCRRRAHSAWRGRWRPDERRVTPAFQRLRRKLRARGGPGTWARSC